MKRLLAFILLIVLAQGCSPQPMVREIISSPNAPAAIGPYSQAVRVGNRLYLSGQLGMDPATGDLTEGGFAAQARQALENQRAILETAGFSFEDVVQCQVFLTDCALRLVSLDTQVKTPDLLPVANVSLALTQNPNLRVVFSVLT